MRKFLCVRFTACAVLFVWIPAGPSSSWAQTISPVSQEFNKKARGAIEVTNDGDAAKVVSCRAQGFDANEHGQLIVHSLDPALHVRIAAQGLVLQPKGSRQVSFDADSALLPAWFLVTCRFLPVDQVSGLNLALELSSIVIVQPGGRPSPADVTLSARRLGSIVEVQVKNNGPTLLHVPAGEVLGHHKQADLRSFFLFPHQTRLLEADWKEEAPPLSARIQVGKKRLESPVH